MTRRVCPETGRLTHFPGAIKRLDKTLGMGYIYTMIDKPERALIIPPVSSAAPAPLYQQIMDNIKREVSEGRLKAGEPLPSFRALAASLLVSLITVKRAYEELEREGIVYCKQGLGTFVSENGTLRSRQAKAGQAETLLREALREASEAGLSNAELLRTVRRMLDERSR